MSLMSEFVEYELEHSDLPEKRILLLRNKVEKIESSMGMKFEELTSREQFIEFVDQMNLRQKARYSQETSMLRRYQAFLKERGLVSQEQIDILESIKFFDLTAKEGGNFYYKDIAFLKAEIENSVRNASNSTIDVAAFYPAICAVYLSWFGLTPDEFLDIKLRDVLDDKVIVNGNALVFPDFVMDVLKSYRDANGFYQQAKGVVFRYFVDSEYLFRSNKKARLEIENVRANAVRLNKVANEGAELTVNLAYRSGILHRAYVEEVVSKTFNPATASNEELSRIFRVENVSKSRKNLLLSDYKRYKKMFEV